MLTEEEIKLYSEKYDLSEAEIEEYYDAFNAVNKNGKMMGPELDNLLRMYKIRMSHRRLNMIVQSISGEKGYIDFGDFLGYMMANNRCKISYNDVAEAFNLFDTGNTGYIEKENLIQILSQVGLTFTQPFGLLQSENPEHDPMAIRMKVEKFMGSIDADGDDRISYAEFLDFVEGLNRRKEKKRNIFQLQREKTIGKDELIDHLDMIKPVFKSEEIVELIFMMMGKKDCIKYRHYKKIIDFLSGRKK